DERGVVVAEVRDAVSRRDAAPPQRVGESVDALGERVVGDLAVTPDEGGQVRRLDAPTVDPVADTARNHGVLLVCGRPAGWARVLRRRSARGTSRRPPGVPSFPPRWWHPL